MIHKILKIENLTSNVKRFVVERNSYKFASGQAANISLGIKRTFTITSLPSDDFLEFMIKCYPEHMGLTVELFKLKEGDKLEISKPFWSQIYNGEGTFVTMGIGIASFISIFRELYKSGRLGKNKLIYTNKTQKDIILEDELKEMFKDNLKLHLTREKKEGYNYGRIKDLKGKLYVCGSPKFMADMKQLKNNSPEEK